MRLALQPPQTARHMQIISRAEASPPTSGLWGPCMLPQSTAKDTPKIMYSTYNWLICARASQTSFIRRISRIRRPRAHLLSHPPRRLITKLTVCIPQLTSFVSEHLPCLVLAMSAPVQNHKKYIYQKNCQLPSYGPPLPLDIQHHRLFGSKPWSPPRTMNILGRDVEILGKNQPGAWELTFFVFGLSTAVVFARLVSRLHSRQFGIGEEHTLSLTKSYSYLGA